MKNDRTSGNSAFFVQRAVIASIGLIFFTGLSRVHAWEETFDRPTSVKAWDCVGRGGGRVRIVRGRGPDGSAVLALDMPAVAGKQAFAVCREALPQPDGAPLVLVFDMSMERGPHGWGKGILYGRPGHYAYCGRIGQAGGAAARGNIFLDGERGALDVPLDAWLHYELRLTETARILRVWAYRPSSAKDPNAYAEAPPLLTLHSEGALWPSGNELIAVNGSLYGRDTWAQDRGLMRLDGLRLSGGRPPEAARPARDTIDLEWADTRFALDSRSGGIAAIDRGDTAVAGAGPAAYILRLRRGITLASEREDRVFEPPRRVAGGLVFRCRNPRLPWLVIEKTYRVESNRLLRTVRFEPEKTIEGFLYLRCGLDLASSFRRGGSYATLRGWGLRSLTPAAAVVCGMEMGTRHGAVASQLVSLMSPAAGLSVAHYVYRLDGHWVWPSYEVAPERLIYNRQGWSFPVFCFHPEAGKSRSATTAIELVRGSQLAVHRRLCRLPELAAAIAQPCPAWVHDVKIETACWQRNPASQAALLQGLVDASRYDKKECGVLTIWGWASWSYIPLEDDEWVQTRESDRDKTSRMRVREYARLLRGFRQRFPGVRYGLYHFLSSMAPQHPFAKAHSDWWAYGPDGSFLPQPEPGWTAVRRLLTAPGAIPALLSSLERELGRYGCDFLYIDGGSKARVQPCWRRLRTDQPYDYHDWWKRLAAYTRLQSPPRALFLNHALNPHADLAYIEIGDIRNEVRANWRALANSLLTAKLHQRPGQYVGLLYRRGSSGPAEPAYTNLVLATGLRPTGAGSPGLLPKWPELFGYMPYLDAAFELRDTVLVEEALVRPRFWEPGYAGPFQAQVLRQGGTALITVVNHDPVARKGVIEVDFDRAGLDPGRPVFCFLEDVRPADIRRTRVPVPGPAAVQPFERVVTERFLGSRTGRRQAFELTIPGNSLQIIACSQAPAVVVAVGGRPTQFHLADMLGLRVESVEDNARERVLGVVNPHDKAELDVPIPRKWSPEKLRVEGASARLLEPPAGSENYRMRFTLGSGQTRLTLQVRIP